MSHCCSCWNGSHRVTPSINIVFLIDCLRMLLQVDAVVQAHEKREDFMKAFLTEFSGSVNSRISADFSETHTQPFYCSYGICPGPPRWAGTRKVKPGRLKPIWIYWSKRQWVAVASAGPYASLHLIPDNHANIPPLIFYRLDALPATQPTASKHWRQILVKIAVDKVSKRC